ncbi:hypothetical protein PtA15_10A431 [Puccinia triticina]|uniref:Uncharacterized protein n=1 Tax=Puccinia triticina TaxID=208348 RepID=A0ABY7CXC9_9BASI|nr:uncharacterized protein PtA15_10A431 [Puccinia triticina]WAQ89008.1 hypothetical protein PtA15_10A431 [Puccinia triticina]
MLTLRPSVVAGCSSDYSMLLKLYPLGLCRLQPHQTQQQRGTIYSNSGLCGPPCCGQSLLRKILAVTDNNTPPPLIVSPRSSLAPGPGGRNKVSELGKGAGRTKLFYLANSINPAELADNHPVRKDDLVIVEADLGKFVRDHVLIKQVVKFQTRQQELLQDLPTNGITPLWAPLLESLTMLLSLQPLSPESHQYITGR